jgi:D-aspartate ligase
MTNCALILGTHINALGIIWELADSGVNEIYSAGSKRGLATASRYIKQKFQVSTETELLNVLKILDSRYDKIVVYPTSDDHLEFFEKIHTQTPPSCILPFTPSRTVRFLNKKIQYEVCEAQGIPVPKTIKISSVDELSRLQELTFPIIIKPSQRKERHVPGLFRNLIFSNMSEASGHKIQLTDVLDGKIDLLASEIIPGESDQVFAYTAFVDDNGRNRSSWSGRKLSQFPNDFGVFSSASTGAPLQVSVLGKKVVETLNIQGIIEPEFKYDYRDGSYKLMEVNLRTMMWHRVGALSGVNLHVDMFNYFTGKENKPLKKKTGGEIVFIYWKHELRNVLQRKGYYKTLFRILLRRKKYLASIRLSDPMPFLYDLLQFFLRAVSK